jgi:hypothetical protein
VGDFLDRIDWKVFLDRICRKEFLDRIYRKEFLDRIYRIYKKENTLDRITEFTEFTDKKNTYVLRSKIFRTVWVYKTMDGSAR